MSLKEAAPHGKEDRLTDAQVRGLENALKLMHEALEVTGEELCREGKIVEQVVAAWGTGKVSTAMRMNWASWLSESIMLNDASAFERMSIYAAALGEKTKDGKHAPRVPSQVLLPTQLKPKMRQGGPRWWEKETSNIRLFARAAKVPVMFSILFRDSLPSAGGIEACLNEIRKHLDKDAPEVSPGQFSTCVKAFGLRGLLRYERKKPGPKMGSRQVNRNESGIRFKRTQSKRPVY